MSFIQTHADYVSVARQIYEDNGLNELLNELATIYAKYPKLNPVLTSDEELSDEAQDLIKRVIQEVMKSHEKA